MPSCPVCLDTGRAKTETIDGAAMVAWCRCPAGVRALDAELAERRTRGGAPEDAPVLRAVPPQSAPTVIVEPPATGRASGPSIPLSLGDAQLVGVGYRADERGGTVHYLTLRIHDERIDVPCDRQTADAFAARMRAGSSPQYRLTLERVRS